MPCFHTEPTPAGGLNVTIEFNPTEALAMWRAWLDAQPAPPAPVAAPLTAADLAWAYAAAQRLGMPSTGPDTPAPLPADDEARVDVLAGRTGEEAR